jgi:tetratricopeptide (TPR) repeat protein
LIILALYGRTLVYGLLQWDDRMLLVDNPVVQHPTLEGLRSVWLQGYAGVYMPLTYLWWTLLEPLADRFGPGVHHAGNLLLFAVGSHGVYRLLGRLGLAGWPALVGALFWVVHPLQVESVAWVSETKGLLAFALGIWAVVLHIDARAETDSALGGRRAGWAQTLYLLALLSKPSAVAFPLLAGWIDLVWSRYSLSSTVRSLWLWVALGIGLIAMTHVAQNPVSRTAVMPLDRLSVALDAVAAYASKVVYPMGLGPDYGRRPATVLAQGWAHPWIAGVAWGAIVAALAAIARWKDRSWALAGGWFLLALLPVLGWVPFGFQEISTVADRYVLPALVGPAIGVAWGIQRGRWIPRVVGMVGLATLFWLSSQQVRHWADDPALIAQALRVRPESGTFLCNRSAWKLQQGDLIGAEADARAALLDRPTLTTIYFNLAASLRKQGRPEEAVATLERVYTFEPGDRRTTETIIALLASQRRYKEAIPYARRLAESDSKSPADTGRLARLLIVADQTDEGVRLLAESLGTDLDPPKDVLAIAQVLEQMHEHRRAIDWYESLLKRSGGFRAAKRRLAWLLVTTADDSLRDPARGVRLARELNASGGLVTPTDLDVLAAGLASLGEFEQAVETVTQGIHRAQELGDTPLVEQASARRELYRRRQPFRIESVDGITP